MNDLPRLLLCAFEVLPGDVTGSSRRIVQYLRVLTQQFQVVVLSVKAPDQPHIQRFEGAQLLRIPVGEGDLPSRVEAFERAVRRQLASEEYAAVHFFDPFSGATLCEERARYGYALIYDATRLASPAYVGVNAALLSTAQANERRCALSADRVLTGAAQTARHFEALGVPAQKLRVVRTPVPNSDYPAKDLPLSEDPTLRALYLGAPLSPSALETLAMATAAVAQRVAIQLTLAMRPPSQLEPRLHALLADQVRAARLVFVAPGDTASLPFLLRSAHVGLLPLEESPYLSRFGDPLCAASEYLAAGRAIVAADLGLTRELLPEDATLFHRCSDAFSLAAQWMALGRDEELRRDLGIRARAYAEAVLTPRNALAPLVSTYQELLGTRATGVARAASSLVVPPEASEVQGPARGTPGNEAEGPTLLAPPRFGALGIEETRSKGVPEEPAEPLFATTDEHDASVVVTDEERVPQAIFGAPIGAPVGAPEADDGPELVADVEEVVSAEALDSEASEAESSEVLAKEVPPSTLATRSGPPPLPAASAPRVTPALAASPPPSTPESAAPSPLACTPPVTPPPLLTVSDPAPAPVPAESSTAAAPRVAPPPLPVSLATAPLAAAVPTTASLSEPAASTTSRTTSAGADSQAASSSSPTVSFLLGAASSELSSADGSDRASDLSSQLPSGPSAEALPPLAERQAASRSHSVVTPPRTPPMLRVPPPLPSHRAPSVSEAPAPSSPIPPISEGDAALAVEVKQVSVLDPWFAQLAHGYCPPEGLKSFSRHTPPTNFPGRDRPPGEQQTS